MQGLIGRTSDNSNQAKIFVLFARTEATYDEEFVGIALTREQEHAMGEHVDSPSITCWTEEVPLPPHQFNRSHLAPNSTRPIAKKQRPPGRFLFTQK